MNMSSIKNIIDNMKLQNLHTHRGTCPVCGGHSTLTVTYNQHVNRYVYNCFRVSCDFGGTIRDTSNMDILNQRKDGYKPRTQASDTFVLPTYLTRNITSPDALKWLIDKHAVRAYNKGYFTLYEDKREERIVVPLYDGNGLLVNAIGRAWNKEVRPKVKVYGKGLAVPPFICGQGKILVIVEDFASAAHISLLDNYVGYAILGTQFNLEHHAPIIERLKPERIIIALDKDALLKSMDIHRRLASAFNIRIRFLPLLSDIKDMDTEHMNTLLTNALLLYRGESGHERVN